MELRLKLSWDFLTFYWLEGVTLYLLIFQTRIWILDFNLSNKTDEVISIFSEGKINYKIVVFLIFSYDFSLLRFIFF